MVSATPSVLTATALICTHNRADLLAEALESLGAMRLDRGYTWEVLVVDNNSTDHTRRVITERQAGFPVRLRYIFEGRQGKSYALNTGIAASTAHVIVFGDDDQRFVDGWIDEACAPLLREPGLDYTGGPVRPIWGARPPRWLDLDQSEMQGPLGTFDYGRERFIFEERCRPAPGGNMAVRRELFDRIGSFCVDLGRTGESLLGQEQAEFFCRSRAVGARGLHVPTMEVYHHVPAARLTRRYFRRWWYWRGISRARLHRLHPVLESGLDLRQVPTVARVPRFMYGTLLRDVARWCACLNHSRLAVRFAHELRVWYFLGYLRERQRGFPPGMRKGRSCVLSGNGSAALPP